MARPKGATPRKAPSTMSFFAAMLVGMILTVGIGLFVYLWNPFNQGKTTSAEEAPMVQPKVQDKPKTNNYEFSLRSPHWQRLLDKGFASLT